MGGRDDRSPGSCKSIIPSINGSGWPGDVELLKYVARRTTWSQLIIQKRHANANRFYSAELAYDACPWIAMARKHCCNGNGEGREEFQSGRCQEWPKEQLQFRIE